MERLRTLYTENPTREVARIFGLAIHQVDGCASRLGLRKSAAYLATSEAKRFHRGEHRSRATEFKPGQVSHNKGTRRPGYAVGRMATTQFKKGTRNGQAALHYKPLGSTRINGDGYLDRKVAETGYPPRDWRAVHILMWEEQHGPLPSGHAVVFKDGDRTHIEIDNLECITRAELMRRNTIHRLPKELVEVIQLKGALKHRITTMIRKAEGETNGKEQHS
jgi:hypothetical protein